MRLLSVDLRHPKTAHSGKDCMICSEGRILSEGKELGGVASDEVVKARTENTQETAVRKMMGCGFSNHVVQSLLEKVYSLLLRDEGVAESAPGILCVARAQIDAYGALFFSAVLTF